MKKSFRIGPRAVLAFICIGVVLTALYGYGVLQGWFLLNNPSREQYPIRGVDVSHYQGDIDWEVLSRQDIRFAYIKATEGSSHTDERFRENWDHAADTELKVGAYHFFSYDSPGETQAQNFIETVPVTPGSLPPVVDIEFYGSYLDEPADAASTKAILDPLLDALEERYGVKPILYATYRSYQLYLSGREYRDYPLWISSPLVAPLLHDWDFWQYSHAARLEGYQGREQRIDLNVFRGSQKAFDAFGLPTA